MSRHIIGGDVIDADHPLQVGNPDGSRIGSAVPSALVAYRRAIRIADGAIFPDPLADASSTLWLANSGGYDTVHFGLVGITSVTDPSGLVLLFREWKMAADGTPRRGALRAVTPAPHAPYTATLSNAGVVVYQPDGLSDDGQSSFTTVRPLTGAPSLYAVIAAPALPNTHPSFFGWVAADSEPPTIITKLGHAADAGTGWVGGTPDGTVTGYTIRRYNIDAEIAISGLGGAAVALVLESAKLSGVDLGPGYMALDVEAQFA